MRSPSRRVLIEVQLCVFALVGEQRLGRAPRRCCRGRMRSPSRWVGPRAQAAHLASSGRVLRTRTCFRVEPPAAACCCVARPRCVDPAQPLGTPTRQQCSAAASRSVWMTAPLRLQVVIIAPIRQQRFS